MTQNQTVLAREQVSGLSADDHQGESNGNNDKKDENAANEDENNSLLGNQDGLGRKCYFPDCKKYTGKDENEVVICQLKFGPKE